MAKIVSVIDIGSNSARMAIFAKTSRFGFYLLEEKKSRVRISEGSYDHQGYLQEIPISRTLNALKEFVQIAKNRGSRKILCVATSALRDAPNRQDFIKRAKEECKIQIRVINGEKEAYYGALACLNLLHHNEGLCIDVGGGSSECAILNRQKIYNLFSLDIGAIRLKELFFDGKENIQGAKQYIQQILRSLPQDLQSDYVLGIGGSIRAITKIILKNLGMQFFHGIELDSQKYIAFCHQILSSSSEKLKLMGFGEDRIDSIRSGALIFACFLEHFKTKFVITSGVGVREGVFLEDLFRNQPKRFPPNFYPSLRCLLDRFGNSKYKILKQEALKIFDTLFSSHNHHAKRILSLCASMALTGECLGSHMQSFHSAYLAFNTLEYGFSLDERLLFKAIIEQIGKKLPKEHKNPLLSLQELRQIISILTLCKILTQHPSFLTYRCKNGKTLIIGGASYLAKEQINKQAKIIDFEIEFEEHKPLKSHYLKASL